MNKKRFFEQFIRDVKIRIDNEEQCYKFQEIAFEFGVRVHSCMDEIDQQPMAYNISDRYPEYKGRSFATNMDNLVIYDNGTRLQKSAFYALETNREIKYDDFINAYNNIIEPIAANG